MLTKILTALTCGALLILAPQPTPAKADPGPYTFAIISPWGFAHGCAVNGATVTNRHVVDPVGKIGSEPPVMFFRYEVPGSHVGIGKGVAISPASDLAEVVLNRPPKDYAILAPAPKIGDRLTWVEYDFRKTKDILKPRVRTARITHEVAGHLILDKAPTPGASGGCAYLDDRTVVGIIMAYVPAKDGDPAGMVLSLYGDWWMEVAP
jgi:hypothetical protein